MLKQLRVKIVCVTMAIVTVMLCVIFGLVCWFTGQNLEAESIRLMQAVAKDPLRPGQPGERPEEVQLPYIVLEIGPRGEMIAAGGGYYDLSDEAFLRELLTASLSGTEDTGVLEAYNLRYCRVTTPRSQSIVFADMSSEQATMQSLTRTCLFLGVLSFLVLFGISLSLARLVVRPVEQAWRQQKQFVADASHELKTPLTVIMTNAELLQDAAEQPQCARSILTMARQMRGLVESLLELARVDSGAVRTACGEVDFSRLISDGVLLFEPVCFEHTLELVSWVEDGIRVKGSEPHLRQVEEILLDNAVKYSTPGGKITVRLDRQGSSCVLSVTSPGPPLSREERKRIFERFYRADPARSMNHSYGLGLSIAQSIVQEHRGRIWAESGEGQNTFFVQLPSSL